MLMLMLVLEEVVCHNMTYFYRLHATDIPSQSMRDESGQLVIYSHWSCYCHRCLVKVKVNMTDITTHVLLTYIGTFILNILLFT